MKKIIIPLFFLTLTSSCFQHVDKEKAQVASTPLLENTKEKIRVSGFFDEKSWKAKEWWTLFSDSQLNSLIEKAVKNNPTLQMAEDRVIEAQMGAKVVRSTLFPQLGARAEDNWQYLSKYGFFRDFYPLPPGFVIPSKFNELDLSLDFSFEIDFFGKNRKQLSQALGLALAEQMEKNQAELVLCCSVAFAYFNWQTHSLQKDLYERWLTCEERLEKFFELRYLAGVDQKTSSLEQKQHVAELKQQVIDLEKELEIDCFFLKELLGEGPENQLLLEVNETLFQKPLHLPEEIGLDLIAQRPDLMAQIWRVQAASQGIEVAKTEFYPNVDLRAVAGLSSLTFSHFFQWASRTGGLNPAIHLPVFTGGRLKANLSGKLAFFNETVHEYNSLLLKAAEEVSSEITVFLSLEKQIEIQQKVVSWQAEVLSLSSMRYEKGVDDYSTFLSSLKSLLSQEINNILLRQSQILSAIRLIKSVGGDMNPQPIPSY